MARARPRGRWLRTRCPHPPRGPGSPPGPSGAPRPAAADDGRPSQPEDAGPRALARPAPRCRAPAPPPAPPCAPHRRPLAPASSPSAPRGCGSSLRVAPWGRGSWTSARSPCVRTQPHLPWGPGLRSKLNVNELNSTIKRQILSNSF